MVAVAGSGGAASSLPLAERQLVGRRASKSGFWKASSPFLPQAQAAANPVSLSLWRVPPR